MAAHFVSGFPSGSSRRIPRTRRAESNTMTESQIQAYLLARDAVRRVKRTSSFFFHSGQVRGPDEQVKSRTPSSNP
jgi:hypothetical protein